MLQVNGSGDMNVGIKATNAKAKINGSGEIKVSGKTIVFNATVTGSGDIDGTNLSSKISIGKVIGSGNIKFYAEEKLEAKVIGSGNIEVNGSVNKIEKKIIGSGEVIKK